MKNEVLDREGFIGSYRRTGLGRSVSEELNWLPLIPSPELAELVGYIFSDGSLERSYGKIKDIPSRIDFISDDYDLRKRVKRLMAEIFYAESKDKSFRNTKGLRFNKAHVTRALWLLGIPLGSKANDDYDVPEWIKNSDRKTKVRFIRAYFDCDASKPYKIYGSKASFGIRLTINKRIDKIESGINFLGSIGTILKEFNIEYWGPYVSKTKVYAKKNGDKTIMLQIAIHKQQSLINYYEKIGFSNKEKMSKLKECVRKIRE